VPSNKGISFVRIYLHLSVVSQ